MDYFVRFIYTETRHTFFSLPLAWFTRQFIIFCLRSLFCNCENCEPHAHFCFHVYLIIFFIFQRSFYDFIWTAVKGYIPTVSDKSVDFVCWLLVKSVGHFCRRLFVKSCKLVVNVCRHVDSMKWPLLKHLNVNRTLYRQVWCPW